MSRQRALPLHCFELSKMWQMGPVGLHTFCFPFYFISSLSLSLYIYIYLYMYIYICIDKTVYSQLFFGNNLSKQTVKEKYCEAIILLIFLSSLSL